MYQQQQQQPPQAPQAEDDVRLGFSRASSFT
jgi:hypothetical protein